MTTRWAACVAVIIGTALAAAAARRLANRTEPLIVATARHDQPDWTLRFAGDATDLQVREMADELAWQGRHVTTHGRTLTVTKTRTAGRIEQ